MPTSASWVVFFFSIVAVVARPRVAGIAAHPAVAALLGAFAMLLLGGLRPAEVVNALSELWRPLVGVASIIASAAVALVSALGSAIFNNHPMALVNAAALGGDSAAAQRDVLAALVGGDLGPRLLPIGSLAGLLWLDALRRQGIRVSFRTFARVGLVTTIPSVIIGALVVEALSRTSP